jgi:ribosomal protein S18 acetylase RimI-like enzyme
MSISGATIRRIGNDEVDAFRRVRLEALRAEPSSFASSFDEWQALSDAQWCERLRDPVFIAFQNAEPVGIMGLLRQRASKMAHRATIIMVYVRAAQRGNGLAKELLDTVAANALEEGIWQLELAVSTENPVAIRFYRREGFSEAGRIPGGILRDGREIDDLIMVRRLIG